MLNLRFPSKDIDTFFAPALLKLFSKLRALQAIQLVAEYISVEITKLFAFENMMKIIQVLQCVNDESQISDKWVYNRLTGQIVATNKRWFNPSQRPPVTSAAFNINDINDVLVIIADRAKNENVQFSFRAVNQPKTSDLATKFIEHCADLSRPNQYSLTHEHDAFQIEIQPMEKTSLEMDEIRWIQIIMTSHTAVQLLEKIPSINVSSSTMAYNVIFAPGFSDGARNIEEVVQSFCNTHVIRVLQFNELDLIKKFFSQLSDLRWGSGFLDGPLAISGWVDSTINMRRTDIPFEQLKRSKKLKHLLLRGINRLESAESDDIEPDVGVCYEAIGLTRPDREKALCIRIMTGDSPYYDGGECFKDISWTDERFLHFLINS